MKYFFRFRKKLFLLSASTLLFACCLVPQRLNAQIVSPQWQYEDAFGLVLGGGILDSNDVYHVLINSQYDEMFTRLLAIDSSGNLVSEDTIAGEGYGALCLDKKLNSYFIHGPPTQLYSFDDTGNERWKVDVPHCNYGYKMVVDNACNSYYVSPYDDGSHSHIVAMKIDSSGNILWITYPITDSTSSEEFKAMALDNEGGIFLTGDIKHDGESLEFYTVHINSDGTIDWWHETSYGGISPFTDIAVASDIAVDDSGNPYITGKVAEGATDKTVTLKFSAEGVVEWTGIGGPTINTTHLYIELDAANNVLVLGERPSYSAYLTKYDTAGNQLWSIDSETVSGLLVSPLRLAVDSIDIVLLGVVDQGGYWENYNYITIKYSSMGILQWYSIHDNLYSENSQDWLELASFDSKGNIIVAGSSYCDDGCNFEKVDIFKFKKGPLITNIESFSSSCSVFPNPFHESFQIQLPDYEDQVTIELYNALGEKVLYKEISGNSARINSGNISPGIYFAILKKEGNIIGTMKLISD